MKRFYLLAWLIAIILFSINVNATVTIETTRIQYSCNGVTTVYTYPFEILEDDDLLAIKASSTGSETTLVLNVDYTVAGAGSTTGGTVTLTAASRCTSGYTLTLLRNIELTQETDYVDGEAFSAESLENALDKTMLIQQQQQEELDRSMRVQKSSTLTDLTIAPTAGKAIGFNSVATGLTTYNTSSLATIDFDNLSNYSSINAAITAIGATEQAVVCNTAQALTANLVIPANVQLIALKGCGITTTGYSLTINGSLDAGLYQIFSGTGSVVFGNGSIEKVPVQWFGAVGDGVADDSDALIAAAASVEAIHGVVFIPSGSTLRVTKTIPMGGISLIGAQRDTSRIFADYDGTVLSTGPDSLSHFVMKNITLTGELAFTWTLTSATSQIGLLLTTAHKSIIENCYFVHLDTAIQMFGGSYYGVIERNLFRTNKISVHLLADTPSTDAPNETNIIFNQFDIWPASQGGPGATTGIVLEGVAAAALSSPKIIGNGFENIATGIDITRSNYGLYLHNRFEDVTTYITDDANSFNNLYLGGNLTDLSKVSLTRPNWNLVLVPATTGTYKGYPINFNATGHMSLGYMEYTDDLVETVGLGFALANGVIEFLTGLTGDGYGYEVNTRTAGAGGLKLLELRYRNNSGTWTTAFNINQYGQISVGTAEAGASCALDITSTTGALRVPRMTAAQRNALTASKGMIIYDSDTDKLQVYNGAWTDLH